MTKRLLAACATLALIGSLAACESHREARADTTASPSASATTPDVVEHESGPDSPIAYGIRVPRGATQLGPLVRYRSARLIDAYQPELQAALAQQLAEQEQAEREAEENGETLPTPTPTPETRPRDDTFTLLEDPPRPDTTVSLMRIDDDPTDVVYRMIGQIAVVLPYNSIDPDDLETYCDVARGRFTGCLLRQRGLTASDRDIRVTLTVDPGNLRTRTSSPGARTMPVMTLKVEYLGDPRKGQIGKDTDGIGDMPSENATAPDAEAVWPRMDLDAPTTRKMLDDSWTLPSGAAMLLSGTEPAFVAVETDQVKEADVIAREWAASVGRRGRFTEDTAEDLNEISTTYTARSKDGAVATGTYIVSARGSYAMLFYTPAA